jgi:hypothetical protein
MNVFSITKKKDFNFLMDIYSDNPYGGKIEIPFFGYDGLFG